jgi:hypothetical protein
MSLRIKRSLCSACLQFSHRRRYSSQAVLLRTATAQASHSGEGQPNTPQSSSNALHYLNDQNALLQGDAGQQAPKPTEGGNGSRSIARNPLEPNKVDLYLTSLSAAGPEPTLVDIERCRPKGHSDPLSPQYAEDYNALVDTLCRSFTKKQLRRFVDLYGIPGLRSRSTRKLQYAENIIEKQWDWPSLKDMQNLRRDATEVSTKCKLGCQYRNGWLMSITHSVSRQSE